jgi:hypothetical protein
MKAASAAVKQVQHRELPASLDGCRNYCAIRHVAVERGRMKCYVDHLYAGSEARMIWRRRLFFFAARKQAETKQQNDRAE